ncbi:hypothetical protein HZ992_12490 [Rhizobacter sp. AJA081-3]|uniref:hypothetical protein n=1 Tax=Rhizobacter sp. AJA081-3 TaxID=2753607 RepID=UPI001ADFF97B|nr:hypothetical protein [Rhizobacter sp. AJA081-3]QTN25714.1 hypothetical protein HZ992_12490 [Rhizobacter sp. AJA081-3]
MWIESSWYAAAAFGIGVLASHLLTNRRCRARSAAEIERHLRARIEAESRAQQAHRDLAMARLQVETLRQRQSLVSKPLHVPCVPLPPTPRPAFATDPAPRAEPSPAFADTQPSDWI